MQKTYIIHIHSFVDLITNSSTEIYIQAGEKSVDTIRKLIDNILAAGGSKLSCDDLFVIGFDKDRFVRDYCYGQEKKEYADLTPEQFYAKVQKEEEEGDGVCHDIYIKAISKDNSPEAEAAAKVLSALDELFISREGVN